MSLGLPPSNRKHVNTVGEVRGKRVAASPLVAIHRNMKLNNTTCESRRVGEGPIKRIKQTKNERERRGGGVFAQISE